MFHGRRLRLVAGDRGLRVLLAVLVALLPGSFAAAQTTLERDFSPGLGLVFGQGLAEENAVLHRFGLTSRRMKEGARVGSLALVAEGYRNGVPFEVLDPALTPEQVSLNTQAVFAEIKRYFSVGGIFHYYWALRGGFSSTSGKISDPETGATVSDFKSEQIAPLGLFALPLALENPGFLLLAFVDGASFGLTLDVVPNRMWLDLQAGGSLLPAYRNTQVVIDQPMLMTSVLQLVVVF